LSVQLVVEDGSPNWWESTSIWVVPGSDPNGSPGVPVAGQSAYLWARVRNDGDTDVSAAQVDFWIANPSLQIRKSTATHIGSAYVDVPAAGSQDVLCLVPWHVTFLNGGHECAVVEVSSPADPLAPTPADPDVLDAPAYRQIAQRNLSVINVMARAGAHRMIGVNAGSRADKEVEIAVHVGGELSREQLALLGLEGKRHAGERRLTAQLSRGPQSAEPRAREGKLQLTVPRGTSVPVYVELSAAEGLGPDEYAVIHVTEHAHGRVIGGYTTVAVRGDDDGRAAEVKD